MEGHPFVVKSSLTAYQPGSAVVRSAIRSEVKRVSFNGKTEKATFRAVVTPDAEVFDTVSGRVTPPARKAPAAPVATVQPTAETAGAVVPPDGWAPTATMAAYGSGAILLVVAIVLGARGASRR